MMTEPAAPVAIPASSHGRRRPQAERVLSLRTPTSGVMRMTIAQGMPMASDSAVSRDSGARSWMRTASE